VARQRVSEDGQELAEGVTGRVGELARWFEAFRQTRVAVQILLSGALVLAAWVSHAWPVGPLARLRDGLHAAVTQDYDFRGQASRASAWATVRGGWVPAAKGLWQGGVTRVQALVPLPSAPDITPPAKTPPAKPGSVAPPKQAAPDPEPTADTVQPEAVMPVDGPVLYGYGWLPKGKMPHEGLDLAAKVGAPVVAMAAGTVVRVATDETVNGLVEVDHGFAVALYGQVMSVEVKVGDRVEQGQLLALVSQPSGKEGDTGSHLHLEVRPKQGAKPIDPAPYLPLNGGSDI
jgi:murein DD-endopeptidase MepM/ murein hydrolase activator NlpD